MVPGARAALENIEIIAVPSDNLTAASAAAADADVAIVVVGATSGESVDRPNLQLENNGDELIGAVANVSNKTVVLMQAEKEMNKHKHHKHVMLLNGNRSVMWGPFDTRVEPCLNLLKPFYIPCIILIIY